MRIRLVLVATLAMSGTLSAQWLTYPTPGVPRTADGKPNLSAPAPRLPDGRPDLSGVWQLETNASAQADYPAAPEFLNLGARLPGAALPYQPWAAAVVNERRAQLGKDDPVGFCKPAGAVRLLTFPPYRKFIQLPALFVILSERDVTYSTGKWEGDMLVVQTNGLREGTWLDRIGSPISEAAKMTERFRRVNFGQLDIDLTIDDPKVYTRAFTVTLHQRIVLDTDLLDYHCNDNERDATHMVGK